MQGGLLTMNLKEIERVAALQQVVDKQIKQQEACRRLRLSSRQIKRLVKRYRQEGASAVISKHRGHPSNRRYTEAYKAQIKAYVEKHYADFGPTLAAEKLYERHRIVISKETLRCWMVSWGLWKAKRQKKVQLHQQRERRGCYGELVQIDGSPHDWFEGRREKCCLLVFIDDATSQLMQLRFEESETAAGYFRATREYIAQYGVPLAFYSDKYGVFRVNHSEPMTRGETQFGRACKALNIELICANSPQAKGRVERANSTLQDRLVKELRLRGINDIESANAYLPEFIVAHNRRFAVKPRNEADAHQRLSLSQEELDLVFSFQHERILSKNLELSFNNVIYQIKTKVTGYRLRHARVRVCEKLEGHVTLLCQGETLEYTCYQKQTRVTPIVGAKQLAQALDGVIKGDRRSQGHKPKMKHPWRQYAATALKKTQVAQGFKGIQAVAQVA
jgi:hypothetical protein